MKWQAGYYIIPAVSSLRLRSWKVSKAKAQASTKKPTNHHRIIPTAGNIVGRLRIVQRVL
jgi:hypothetical protein